MTLNATKCHIVFFTFFFMMGCGKEVVELPPPTIDSALVDYIHDFERDMNVNASHVSAIFADLDSPNIGICYSWSDGRREIKIDKAAWKDMSDIGREALMYHELGHCVLNLDHNNDTVLTPSNATIYGSIMNQYWFGEAWFYRTYRSEYKAALRERKVITP